MKVVVTGAEGHVGNNLCRRLAGGDHEVVAMVYDQQARSLDGVEVTRVHGDVFDRDRLVELFEGADAVVHLAAIVSTTADLDALRVNYVGVRNVVDACLECGVSRLVHMSSIQAIRSPGPHNPQDESCPLVDDRAPPYDYSKALGEQEIARGVDKGLFALILRPTGILGPHDYGPSLMAKSLLSRYGSDLPAVSGGGFDWVDVRDVAAAVEGALTGGTSGQAYILSGRWVPADEFSRTAQSLWGGPSKVRVVPSRVLLTLIPLIERLDKLRNTTTVTRAGLSAYLTGSRRVSNQRAREQLGFSPRSFADTLQDTLRWLRP